MPLGSCDQSVIDEMSIVDVFTKLIFDADAVLNDVEVQIIDCLQLAEGSLAHSPRRDIGEFLRAMGVDEMIFLVAHVKTRLDQQRLIVANRQRRLPTIHC